MFWVWKKNKHGSVIYLDMLLLFVVLAVAVIVFAIKAIRWAVES